MFSLKDLPKKTVFSDYTEAIVEKRVRGLCKKPYYNHPGGCPNFGKRSDCPPGVPFFDQVYKLQVRVVAVGLNFKEYLKLRRKDHPDWTDRELRNPLYWQGYLRACLRNYVSQVNKDGLEVVFNPEAMGVNLTKTCRKVGLKLEWPPRNWVYKVALLTEKL